MIHNQQAIRLTELLLKRPASIAAARWSLKDHGYTRVLVDRTAWREGIAGGLDEASRLDGFRFPPIINVDADRNSQETIRYSRAARLCFQSLFDVATSTFAALASDGRDLPRRIVDSIRGVESAREKDGSSRSLLFGPNFDDHQPFVRPASDPFGQTFFNLFNYSQGLLNIHKDRGLITVIASRRSAHAGSSNGEGNVHSNAASALWVQSPADKTWRNLDQEFIRGEEEVAIFFGEDGESLPFARDLGILAAEHAVRVDPEGGYVPHSHFNPDPTQSEGTMGRVSAAMILRCDF